MASHARALKEIRVPTIILKARESAIAIAANTSSSDVLKNAATELISYLDSYNVSEANFNNAAPGTTTLAIAVNDDLQKCRDSFKNLKILAKGLVMMGVDTHASMPGIIFY